MNHRSVDLVFGQYGIFELQRTDLLELVAGGALQAPGPEDSNGCCNNVHCCNDVCKPNEVCVVVGGVDKACIPNPLKPPGPPSNVLCAYGPHGLDSGCPHMDAPCGSNPNCVPIG